MAVLVCVLALIPLPYTVDKPGPTFDLFAGEGDDTLLSLSGTQTYAPSGELRLTTVARVGGPGSDLRIGGLIRDWLSPVSTVFPDENRYVIPDNQQDSVSQDWVTSQEKAMLAAILHQEIEVPMIPVITEIDTDSNASGLLWEQDIIVAVNGADIETSNDLTMVFEPLEPGDEVTVTVDRAGQETTVSFPTIDNGEGGAIMGIWYNPVYSFPFDVTIDIDDVGGPSGGMIFALGIINLLTPEDELNGESLAGTGTIEVDGTVGEISGIDRKMHGAASDGARWFLAPESNCPEVVGHQPDGLTVVAVSTLEEAYDAMIAIGEGRTSALPSCG